MYTNFESLREEARAHILEMLEDYEGYTCDFHNEAFNSDYYEYYTHEAIRKLEELGVFDAIQTVKEYEQDNFGVVNTDFSDPCAVLNMLWYIIGEEELSSMFEGCEEWDEFWNEEIGETETKVLIAWLKDNDRA